MTDNQMVVAQPDAALLEQVLVVGDLDKLTPKQRLDYILRVCDAVGVNPATRPFEYIRLSGRLTLYARKDCTDQLRRNRSISVVDVTEHTTEEGIHIVWAHVRDSAGREDREMGAVSIKGLGGEALANAYMKCVTKAKRRATLSICGLGMLDETELETIPNVQHVVEQPSGAMIPEPQAEPRPFVPPSSGGATEAQVRAIYAIGRKLEMGDKEIEEASMSLGGAVPADLTKRAASDLIQELQSRLKTDEGQVRF